MESKIVDTLFLCAVKLGSEDEEIPRQVMEPRWAMREGSEAAALFEEFASTGRLHICEAGLSGLPKLLGIETAIASHEGGAGYAHRIQRGD